MRWWWRFLSLSFVAVATLSAAGCLKDDTGPADPIDTVAAEAGGFVGYAEPAEGLTVCGQCHTEKQASWSQTRHAGAWNTLEETGAAQDFCRECHTVNALGNVSEDSAAGWVAVKDDRYHDVQCESCHGPGLEHVRTPEVTQPLAPIEVGATLTLGCGECHQGSHHPFVEDWATSGHAVLKPTLAQSQTCGACHSARGALEAFGVQSEYLEKDSTSLLLPIVCAVCHDPHDATHEGQLRFDVGVASVEQNLCMKCHGRAAQPIDSAGVREPHAPEGPLLLGEAGWRPPNFPAEPGDPLASTHGSDANPRLCATCHVNAFDVTDSETGDFVVHATGHSFRPIPCVDGNGEPTGESNCAITARTFSSCTSATGCHGSESIARQALINARARISAKNDTVKSLLAQVPSSEFDSFDGVYTTAEGARFNSQLADRTGSVAHNPYLMTLLMRATIDQLRTDYGL